MPNEPQDQIDEQEELERLQELEAQWLDRLEAQAGGAREWDNPR